MNSSVRAALAGRNVADVESVSSSSAPDHAGSGRSH
jgi:hypothetical protein